METARDMLFDIPVATIDGRQTTLAPHQGEVLLIVNTASQCGFTPQYAGLEALYRRHKAAGFAVLGFPCDQFGGQEPGDEAQIANFCSLRYDVTFPMYGKVEVNGPGTHPLFAALKRAQPGLLGSEKVKWNFTKFVVDRGGRVVARHAPQTAPEKLEGEITTLVARPAGDANRA